MAPTAPKKRTSLRAKASNLTSTVRPPPAHRPSAHISDSFISSKADKRTIKHSAFVRRIEKPGSKKAVKRRRPSKKLITTLESLVDALPDVARGREGGGDGKIKQKSLKSRPGATKRREKLERMERERFTKNMGQLATGVGQVTEAETGGEGQKTAMAGRWAALRGFIAQTMEQKAEFVKK